MPNMSRVAAEISAAEKDVPTPSRSFPGSSVSVLATLKVGKTHFQNVEITPEEFSDQSMSMAEYTLALKKKIRKALFPALSRVKALVPEARFTTETVTFATDTGRIFAGVLVTRMPDVFDNEEDEL